MRVLGIDPAAAGPTGYGIVESDGRRCRMLYYGAFKLATKQRTNALARLCKTCIGSCAASSKNLRRTPWPWRVCLPR